jgi:arachidonate 5-lipoxygenase
MESVVVCANRQLSPSHPIFRLLAPHFLYLIAINSAAVEQLTAPGAWVDQAMQIGHVGMFNIIRRKWATWDVKEDGNLLKNLKKREVDDETALPHYHYRDDAKLLWNAISEYVAEIVDNVYDTEDKLVSDLELQNFAAELSSPESAGIKGVPEKFTSTDDLKEVLTVFVFTASVQHAAVNFGQYDEYGFSPNYPASIRTERPKTKAPLTEQDIVDALPTKEQMLKVILVTKLLSSKATDSLGYFEMEYSLEPQSQRALHHFRENLKTAGDVIDARNDKRANKYTYLHPREVPNAISI